MKHRQFKIVMQFEFLTYMRNKVYVGITILVVILLALGLSAPRVIDAAKEMGLGGGEDSDDPTQTVYVIDMTEDDALMPYLEASLSDVRWRAGEADQLEAYRDLLNNREARAVIQIESPTQLTFITRRFGTDMLAGSSEHALTQYYQQRMLSDAGLDEVIIGQVLTPPQMERIELVEEAGKSMEQTYFYTYLLLFLLYMTVMMYGQLVASSVASEKSNRAMEMLITSARPLSLMFGKVIGSGLAGLAQIAVFLVSAAGFYKLNESSWTDISFIRSVFEMPLHMLAYTLLFYLAGYFMYAFLYGALGSLASRVEDINTSIMPIILILMAAMFVSFFGMINPDAGFLTVFSFVPFFSPMAMFVRIAMTDVSSWQIALSILIMLATILGTGWISSKIYRIGVLMYGKPPKLPELIKILKLEKASR